MAHAGIDFRLNRLHAGIPVFFGGLPHAAPAITHRVFPTRDKEQRQNLGDLRRTFRTNYFARKRSERGVTAHGEHLTAF